MGLLPEMEEQRWTRGCGSGIGFSGHVNAQDYRVGIRIGNWIEDRYKDEAAATGKHIFGYKGPLLGDSTMHRHFTPEGKTGEELEASYQRVDREARVKELPGSKLFFHGEAYDAPVENQATMHLLAYQPPALGEPKTQAFMWTDATAHNRSVPTNIVGTHGLLAKKRQEWADDEGRNPYASHARVEQLSSTFAAAGHVTKRTSARVQQDDGAGIVSHREVPATMDASGRPDGGQALQAGKVPAGPFNRELEAGYSTVRKTNFRWYPDTPSAHPSVRTK